MVRIPISVSIVFVFPFQLSVAGLVEGWHVSSLQRKVTVTHHLVDGFVQLLQDVRPPSNNLRRNVRVDGVAFLLGLSLLVGCPFHSHAQDWELLNGSVTLSDPVKVSFRDRQTGADRSLSFDHPQIIGAGSGGAVFSFEESDILLKVSWPGTTKTVLRECATLQLLEDAGVEASERCLASLAYDDDPTSRSMILVTPYMKDAVASVGELATEEARKVAVDQIARTLVEMLMANIITIDVQPLISKATGQTIFIDMTEAQVLSSSSTYSFLDQTLITSFVSEMVALIPESYWTIAQTSTMDELALLSRQVGRQDAALRVQGLLNEQTPFIKE